VGGHNKRIILQKKVIKIMAHTLDKQTVIYQVQSTSFIVSLGMAAS